MTDTNRQNRLITASKIALSHHRPVDPRIGELEAANAEQSKLIAEYELEVKERGRQNRAQTEEISRMSNQLKDRDAQVLVLREALGNTHAAWSSFAGHNSTLYTLLAEVSDLLEQHGFEKSLQALHEHVDAAAKSHSEAASKALTSTGTTAKTIAAKIRADAFEEAAQTVEARMARFGDGTLAPYESNGDLIGCAAAIRSLSNKEGE